MKRMATSNQVGHRMARRTAAALAIAIGGLIAVQTAWSSKEQEDAGGPAVTRRLTESQYRATVADIFAPVRREA